MNCFEHPDVNAVGLCKFCQKGLCQDCAHDLSHGLACKDHIREVTDLNSIFLNEAPSFKKVSKTSLETYFLVIGICLIIGPFVFPIFASTHEMKPGSIDVIGAGIGSLLVSNALFLVRQRYTNKLKSEKP